MRLLIATHGTLAEGFKSALSIIIGNVDKIDVINSYVTDTSLSDQLDAYFNSCDDNLVVCTDLFGGSVNPSNAGAYLTVPGVDGLLTGGSSLILSEFVDIIEIAKRVR